MLRLEIVTPEKRVLDSEVDSVTVPTASGEAGILPNHAPLVSALKPGILSYAVKGASEKLVVSSGFVEVNNNKVAVLVDAAETSAEIDEDAARTARGFAERSLSSAGAATADELAASRESMDHALARLQLASGK